MVCRTSAKSERGSGDRANMFEVSGEEDGETTEGLGGIEHEAKDGVYADDECDVCC